MTVRQGGSGEGVLTRCKNPKDKPWWCAWITMEHLKAYYFLLSILNGNLIYKPSGVEDLKSSD